MHKLIVFFLFFFLVFLSSNVYASISLDYNVTNDMDFNSAGMRCINNTADNMIYCYAYRNDYYGAYPYIYINEIERVNSSLGGLVKCSLSANYSGSSNADAMALINETHMLIAPSSAYCDYWDISNIATGTCTLVKRVSYTSAGCNNFSSSHSNGGVYNGEIYIPYKQATVDTDSLVSTPFGISKSFNNGIYNQYNYISSIGDRTTPQYIYTSTVSGQLSTNWQAPHIAKYSISTGALIQDMGSIFDLYGIKNAYNETWFDLIKVNANTTWIFINDRQNARFYRANFTTESNATSCNWGGEHVGTECIDSSNYVTSDGFCSSNISACPAGSYCVQITPVLNATTDLIENYTSCSIRSQLGFTLKCFNLCFNGVVVGGNCVDAGCKVCPNVLTGTINYGGVDGFFTNTYYINSSSISLSKHTISCVEEATGKETVTIDDDGSTKTVKELISEEGYIVTDTPQTQQTPSGTETSSAGGIAVSLGSFFGINDFTQSAWILSMLLSLGVGLVILIYSHEGLYFAVGMVGMLMLFTLIGWFPSWVMIIMIVISAFIIAKNIW